MLGYPGGYFTATPARPARPSDSVALIFTGDPEPVTCDVHHQSRWSKVIWWAPDRPNGQVLVVFRRSHRRRRNHELTAGEGSFCQNRCYPTGRHRGLRQLSWCNLFSLEETHQMSADFLRRLFVTEMSCAAMDMYRLRGA